VRTITKTAEETEELGARLARARSSSRGALAVLYLSGELGSGKTTLVRGFVQAAGVSGPVRSPTYKLLELYPAPGATLVHLDLYRVQSPQELDSLGLREWAVREHLWLIEWPEHGAGRLPAADLHLRFSVGDYGHDVEVTSGSALGASWLVELERAGPGAVESHGRTP